MRQHWRDWRIFNFRIETESKSTYPIPRTRDGSTTTMKSLLLIPVALGALFLASCAGTLSAKCAKCCAADGSKCEKSAAKCPADCKTCKQ